MALEGGETAEAETALREARDIYRNILGEYHPHYAATLSNLAVIQMCSGNYAGAEAQYRQVLNAELRFTQNVLPWLPEGQAMALRGRLHGPDSLLSVMRMLPDAKHEDAFAAVWRTRGLITRYMNRRRGALGDHPEAKGLLTELGNTSRELAQLTLTTPEPEQRESRRQHLADLTHKKERLEKEIASLTGNELSSVYE